MGGKQANHALRCAASPRQPCLLSAAAELAPAGMHKHGNRVNGGRTGSGRQAGRQSEASFTAVERPLSPLPRCSSTPGPSTGSFCRRGYLCRPGSRCSCWPCTCAYSGPLRSTVGGVWPPHFTLALRLWGPMQAQACLRRSWCAPHFVAVHAASPHTCPWATTPLPARRRQVPAGGRRGAGAGRLLAPRVASSPAVDTVDAGQLRGRAGPQDVPLPRLHLQLCGHPLRTVPPLPVLLLVRAGPLRVRGESSGGEGGGGRAVALLDAVSTLRPLRPAAGTSTACPSCSCSSPSCPGPLGSSRCC